jgi:aryl-alcohol dehydrogenase-like predicted oxidoreductase
MYSHAGAPSFTRPGGGAGHLKRYMALRYRLLGASGLRVSELCLGTMTFGEDWGWGSSRDESRRIYDRFREAGGNFIDTANIYTNGTSETLLGEFVEGHRQEVVLATKYTNAAAGRDPNAAGNHRKSMMQAIEASLRRLRTDYIDLYWLHIWDQITPIEEVMRGFEDLVAQGKILYAGISDTPAWVIARGNTMAECRGWARCVGLQIEYSLAERTPERELLPMAKALGLGVTAWSPLAGGLLTGKYTDGFSTSGDGRYRDEMMRQFANPGTRNTAIVQALRDVSAQAGCSVPQAALAWLLAQQAIPIIGARKIAQFEDNLGSVDVKLNAEQLRVLDEASRIELGFPHDFLRKDMVRSFASGGMRDAILA